MATQQRIADALPYEEAPAGYPVQLSLSKAEAERVKAHQKEWPDLKLTERLRRVYTTQAGAPVLGYMTAEAQAFLNQASRYRRGRFFRLRNGGVEAYYNGLLTGHGGIRTRCSIRQARSTAPGPPTPSSRPARTCTSASTPSCRPTPKA